MKSPNHNGPENTFCRQDRRAGRFPPAAKSQDVVTLHTWITHQPTACGCCAMARRRRRSWCRRSTSDWPAETHELGSGSELKHTGRKHSHSSQVGSSEKAGRCGALRPQVAAQVMSMRYEASHVTNAGQGAPSTVPARLPPRSSAQMINSCVAEHQLARLDEPAGRVTAAEDARGGSSRLSGRPLARGGW